VGRPAAPARAIGRPEQAVSDWANGKSLVDPELVVEIERITGDAMTKACTHKSGSVTRLIILRS
jgi:hypothetical protein